MDSLLVSSLLRCGQRSMRMNYRIIALIFSAMAAISIQPTTASAQSAQEFLAQEASGQFGNTKTRQRLQQSQRRLPAQQRQQNQTSETNLFGGVGGLSLGGSWLSSNMGAARPAGAPGLWCGYAMRMEMQSAGHGDPGPSFNLVSNWCQVGTPAPVGAVGSIFVSRGHVSKVVSGNCPAGHVATISGNATGRRVSHMCEPISRAVCSRWPGSVVTQLTR
jgi:hypothetical protein